MYQARDVLLPGVAKGEIPGERSPRGDLHERYPSRPLLYLKGGLAVRCIALAAILGPEFQGALLSVTPELLLELLDSLPMLLLIFRSQLGDEFATLALGKRL